MENQQQITNTPMILGIIGGILGIPAAFCSGACAAGMSAIATADKADNVSQAAASGAGTAFMILGLLAAVLGLVSAFMYKKNTKLWGGLMILGGVLAGITLVTFNILSLIVAILLLIGGLLAVMVKLQEPTASN